MKLRLKDLPEPLRRDAEEFDRRSRWNARLELVLGLAAFAGFVMAVAAFFGVMLGR